ncbi:MAG TPA: hypothetical protein VKU19_42525 [Bryobacteraceae bacterium]|nr:hypothetical protein [Bryobacteraceae bacterium]
MNEIELDQLLSAWVAPAPPPSLRRHLIAAMPEQRRGILSVRQYWLIAAAAAGLCTVVGAVGFESPMLGQFRGQWGDPGLYVQVTRLVDPPVTPIQSWSFGGGNSIGGSGTAALHGSGYVRDRSTKTYAGYEYALKRAGDGQYEVSFAPMQFSTLSRLTGPYRIDGPFLSPPNLPAPQVVQVGESFEVTLSQAGGRRVYDRMVLSWTPSAGWRGTGSAATNATMRLAAPQLYVNGQLAAAQRDAGAGPVVWVHLPGEGRYLIALDPQGNPRFTQAGHVSGNRLEFEAEGKLFRIVCAAPIVTSGDRAVFVYHQQSFEGLLDGTHPLAARPLLGNAGPAGMHVE